MIKAIYRNKIESVNVNVVERDKEVKNVDIKDLFKKKWVFLYYYPAINTSVCSSEIKMVNSILSKFNEEKVSVFGFSRDDVEAVNKYVEKNKINHPLISDEDGSLFEYFNFSNAGKMSRQMIILNKKSEVVYQQTSPAFSGRNFEGILEDIKVIKKADMGIPTTCKIK